MKTLFFSSVIMALFICSCATETETELTDEQKATIIAEVESQIMSRHEAATQSDVDAFYSFYSEDKFISFTTIDVYHNDLSVLIDSARKNWSLIESRQENAFDMRVTPLASNLALSTLRVDAERLLKSGEIRKSTGLIVDIYEKESKGWKVLFHTESFRPIEEE